MREDEQREVLMGIVDCLMELDENIEATIFEDTIIVKGQEVKRHGVKAQYK